jgi:acylphosphatase
MICIHALVSGKVQGVYFRDSTQKRALALQLTGWVQNLADGRVEIIACGTQESIKTFIDWLWEGSPDSKVSDVCWENIPQQTFTDFVIRRN